VSGAELDLDIERARSLAAIGEWAGDAPGQVLAALGVRRDPLTGGWRPPGEATVRRVLTRIDADALDRAIGAWLAAQPPPQADPSPPTPRPRRAVAVDGKTLRGSGHHPSPPVHPLAAMDHTSRAVLGQAEVDSKTNEITRFRPLLEGLDLAGRVVTADALHTQREHVDHTRDRGHGRAEIHRLQVTTVAGLDFPYATQAIRITAGSGRLPAGAGRP
jgi:hypothetical protein